MKFRLPPLTPIKAELPACVCYLATLDFAVWPRVCCVISGLVSNKPVSFQSFFFMLIAERCLRIMIRTTRDSTVTTLAIDSLRLVLNGNLYVSVLQMYGWFCNKHVDNSAEKVSHVLRNKIKNKTYENAYLCNLTKL